MLPRTDLDLDDLRVIHAIVRASGVTRAGASLGLSQSGVSHRLRLIEERLGFDLFERRGRQLEPLPAALRLADTAEQLVAPLAGVERELKSAPTLPPLRLAAQCYTGYGWLPSVLADLVRVHPELAVELVPDVTADPIAALIDGRIDLALATDRPRRSRFVTDPLFEDELVAVLPPGHALASRHVIGSEALVDEPLFLFELGIRQREYFRKRLFPRGGGFRRVHRVPLTEAIVALVRAGAGSSILPRWSVEEALARGEVAVVRLTRGGLRRHWHAVYSRQSPHHAALATLLASLRRVCPDVNPGGGSRSSAGAGRRDKRQRTS